MWFLINFWIEAVIFTYIQSIKMLNLVAHTTITASKLDSNYWIYLIHTLSSRFPLEQIYIQATLFHHSIVSTLLSRQSLQCDITVAVVHVCWYALVRLRLCSA